MKTEKSMQFLLLVPIGVALNLAIGFLVSAFKLPIFLDAIGTILITIIVGWRVGATVGVLSFLVGGLFNPALPYFVGTQFFIALVAGFSGNRGFFKTVPRVIITGIVIGYVAAIASAPVIAVVFGGISTSGESLITAFLMATGKTLWESVISTKIWTEPIDKVIQCLAAFYIIRALPRRVISHFSKNTGYLKKNDF